MDLHQYAYDLGSEVTQQVFTAGNYMNYGYDKIGQLKTASGKGPGGLISRLHEQLGYAYDAAWNLNYRTNNAVIQTFGVNNLNELTNTAVNGAIPLVAGSTTSLATNVTVNGVAAMVYGDATFATTNVMLTNGWNTLTAVAHDSYGRVSSSSIQVNVAASANYSYDLNGNLLSDGTRNFAYDDENQLVGAWVASAWSNSFAYDGLMRKRIERDFSWNGSSWLQTNEVHYVYDGNLVFQERDGSNLPQTTYTRGNDLSGTLQGAGGIGGLLARSDREQVIPAILKAGGPYPRYVITSYYHSDGNGSVTALVEPNGFLVASYKYDPYGNVISMSGPLAEANRYRFSSKEWNSEAGIYYYGYRFYDPNLQRWLNRDPIQEFGGLNLYGFVDNDPVDEEDFYGLWEGWDDALFITGGAISGVVGQFVSNELTGNSGGYLAAAAGGAAEGEVFLYTGNTALAGAAGGFTSSIVRQSQCGGISAAQLASDTAWGGLSGAIHLPGIKGVNKGRGSLEQVAKQIQKKLKNRAIHRVENKTAAKIAGWQAAEHIENAPKDALEDKISDTTDSGESLGTGSGASPNQNPSGSKPCQGL